MNSSIVRTGTGPFFAAVAAAAAAGVVGVRPIAPSASFSSAVISAACSASSASSAAALTPSDTRTSIGPLRIARTMALISA